MKRIVSFVLMLWLAMAAHAVPTVEAVQAEVNRGNYVQAESMMREVVAARPNSAKAHYLYAEVLAHNARFEQAANEAQLAKQIDPQIGFTQPDKFRAFEQLLDQAQRSARPRTGRADAAAPVMAGRAGGSGVPGWVWGAGFAVIAALVWKLVSSTRRQTSVAPAAWQPGSGATAMTPMGPSGPSGMGYGGGMGGGGMAGGSGMLGTGLAAAGGFAAGMLAEKVLDGHHDRDAAANSAAGAGGLVPGMFDADMPADPSADELQRRSIDFGTGGDEWGGDASAGSGSSDDGW